MMVTAGVKAGDEVLTNGFTFTALPSTIMRLNAEPVLVETRNDFTMDLDDLEKKMDAHPNAKTLLLSHMRGKVTDMDRVAALCESRGVTLLEDCAHGCGVTWRGRQLGYHGKLAAYSTQSDKVINSGEGGFVTTDDDAVAAQLIYLSGAYERRYNKHAVRPDDALCEAAMNEMPNLSVRMAEVTAAMMRPLIANLPQRVDDYNRRWESVVAVLESSAGETLAVPRGDARCGSVGDHLNFQLREHVTPAQNEVFRQECAALGAPEFELPNTDALLYRSFDLKMPPHFDDADFVHLASVIAYAANKAVATTAEA